MAIRIPLGLCVVLVRRKEKRIPTTSVRTGLGMTEVGVGGLRRVVARTVLKTTLETKLTCHCEERGTSDVAIRIPLGMCVVLVRRKENGFPRRALPSSE